MSLKQRLPRHAEMCKAEHGGRKSKLKFKKKKFSFIKKIPALHSLCKFKSRWDRKVDITKGAASSQAVKGLSVGRVRGLHNNDVVSAKALASFWVRGRRGCFSKRRGGPMTCNKAATCLAPCMACRSPSRKTSIRRGRPLPTAFLPSRG